MSYYRTPKSIKAYNWFKLAGTLILISIFAMLLLRQQRAAATAPVITPIVKTTTPLVMPTATMQPSPTPHPPTPTATAPTPSVPEKVSAPTVEPTPVPPQPPTLTEPQSGALIAGNLAARK